MLKKQAIKNRSKNLIHDYNLLNLANYNCKDTTRYNRAGAKAFKLQQLFANDKNVVFKLLNTLLEIPSPNKLTLKQE